MSGYFQRSPGEFFAPPTSKTDKPRIVPRPVNIELRSAPRCKYRVLPRRSKLREQIRFVFSCFPRYRKIFVFVEVYFILYIFASLISYDSIYLYSFRKSYVVYAAIHRGCLSFESWVSRGPEFFSFWSSTMEIWKTRYREPEVHRTPLYDLGSRVRASFTPLSFTCENNSSFGVSSDGSLKLGEQIEKQRCSVLRFLSMSRRLNRTMKYSAAMRWTKSARARTRCKRRSKADVPSTRARSTKTVGTIREEGRMVNTSCFCELNCA